MKTPDLSIIIPAYNEEALILSTLDGLQTYLSARPERYEIIVVDDGSQDATVEAIRAWQGRSRADLNLLINDRNMGKGFSIRRGVLESRGRYVVFIDADLPYELYAIDGFLKALRNGCDLAVGSRVLPGSEVRGVPPLRYFAGQVFSWMVQTVLFRGLPDTQCGFKSFRSDAAKEIFRRLTIGGFGFDVELLFIARKLKFAIQPVAVHMIEHRQRSRVRLVVDSLKMFSNLFLVRWLDWQGKYD
ncbi:MAG TPA: dolichyl-phosphate beta-glucosyltransferase [Anaerolineales bacterium]|nr:dolichyl-phosphate beta-glucosyltransferase [Anaerolineales bacterium]